MKNPSFVDKHYQGRYSMDYRQFIEKSARKQLKPKLAEMGDLAEMCEENNKINPSFYSKYDV